MIIIVLTPSEIHFEGPSAASICKTGGKHDLAQSVPVDWAATRATSASARGASVENEKSILMATTRNKRSEDKSGVAGRGRPMLARG